MLIKTIHIVFVVMSGAGFVLRGIGMINGSEWLDKKWVKIVPHIIDTLLLISATILVVQIKQYPITHDWLSAKVIGLLAYIGLGMVALHRGKTRQTRIIAGCLALLTFAYIVGVAVSRKAFILF